METTRPECHKPDALSPGRADNAVLFLVLLGALLLRLVFTVFWVPEWTPDVYLYDKLAKSILHEGALPSAYRSPGYPLFIAGIYWLSGESVTAVLAVQGILSVLSVWLVYVLGVEVLGPARRKVSLVAAALVGFNPEIAAYSGLMLRESLTMLLVLLSGWWCYRMLERDYRYGLGLGGVLAALAYVRMEACLLAIVFLVGALLNPRWRRRAIGGGMMAGGISLSLTLPWVWYCAASRGYLGMQDTLDNCLFYRSWYLAPNGTQEPELRRHILDIVRKHHLTDEEVRRCMITPKLVYELPAGDVRAEAALYRKLGRIGRENIKNNFGQYVVDCIYHFKAIMGGYWLFWWKDYWDAPVFRENIRLGQWWIVAVKFVNRAVWPAAILVFGTTAIVLLWRNRDPAAWPVTLLWLGSMAGIIIVIVVASGETRLRQAYDGILYLTAVLGFQTWRKACRRT